MSDEQPPPPPEPPQEPEATTAETAALAAAAAAGDAMTARSLRIATGLRRALGAVLGAEPSVSCHADGTVVAAFGSRIVTLNEAAAEAFAAA